MQIEITRRPDVDDSHLPDSLPPLLRQLYARRGVTHADQLERSVRALASPAELYGMDGACELLTRALRHNRKIVIVGDFDADGATSTALSVLALRMLGAGRVDFVVPNRFEYGYGLSPEIVEVAAGMGAELIMTVDNGISSTSGVARANALGIPVLITDHHLPGRELPEAAAILNPNQPGCGFPSKHLAGVGVAFYLMLALRAHLRAQNWFAEQGLAEPNLAGLLDIVALGTVADVVPLDANNRVLVHQGLARIRAGQCRPGILALAEVAGRDPRRLVATDLAFALGPRLNAAGRLDDMSLGITCLLSDDPMLARQIASELDSLNRERREIEAGMQQEALAVLDKLAFDEHELPVGICLYQSDWHQGVIGILASRIKERYHRPVIAFADAGGGELKGSARSIAGLHLRDSLEQLDSREPNLILKFGGHAMAAGLTIREADFPRFAEAFDRQVSASLSAEQLKGVVLSDGVLEADALTLEMAQLLRDAGPWGQAFPEPAFDGRFAVVQQRLVGQKHLKLAVRHASGLELDAIAFNIDPQIWPDGEVSEVELVYRLDVNEFRGRQSLQLMVEYLRPLGRR